MSVFSELKRRNVYKIATVYVIGSWLLLQIAGILFPAFDMPVSSMRILAVVLLFTFPIVLTITWAFELSPKGIQRTSETDISAADKKLNMKFIAALSVTGVIAVGILLMVPATRSLLIETGTSAVLGSFEASEHLNSTAEQLDEVTLNSIAVLPFANLSPNDGARFLSLGLSEDIIDKLANLGRLRVASRTSSFQLNKEEKSLSAIGEILKVAYILEGSVQQRGDKFRITAQLIYAATDSHIWSKNYDIGADGFDEQSSIVENVANLVDLELSFDVEKKTRNSNEKFKGIDPKAVNYYLEANYQHRLARLGEGGDFSTSVRLLNKAIEIDSGFLEAYTDLIFLSSIGSNLSVISRDEAVQAALAINPNSESLLLQLGQMYTREMDFAAAEDAFEKLLQLDPHSFIQLGSQAAIAIVEGRIDEAFDLTNRMVNGYSDAQTRPISLFVSAYYFYIMGDSLKALEVLEKLQNLIGDQPMRMLPLLPLPYLETMILVDLNQIEEATMVVDQTWKLKRYSIRLEFFFPMFALIGETEKARAILADPRFEPTDYSSLALGHVTLGNFDDAFVAIETGLKVVDPGFVLRLRTDKGWNPIRDDPRFKLILKHVESKITHTKRYLRDHDL